jgi:PleD family two-component response regulator
MSETRTMQYEDEGTRNCVANRGRSERRKSQDSGAVQTVFEPFKGTSGREVMGREEHEKKTGKNRILVIDEHSSVREGLTRLINDEPGFMVAAEAENAEQALDTISKQQVDLVIADVSLESATGTRLTEDIKSRYPHIPVLVLPVSNFLEK